MTVKELMKELLDTPMSATVEIEVVTNKFGCAYSNSENIKVVWVSDRRVVIMEVEE